MAFRRGHAQIDDNLLMSGFFKTWRRKRALRRERLDQALWQRVTGSLPFLLGLTAADEQRLKDCALLFLDEKEMHGARGFVLTDAVRLSVAVQACLPILNLGLDAYAGWVGIVIYPGEFKVRREELDDSGVVHEYDDELSGEAWPGGPVILSWQDVELGAAGYNVVIHEFAHKLHMSRGDMDDFPLPHAHMDRERWLAAWEGAYEEFCAEVDRGVVPALRVPATAQDGRRRDEDRRGHVVDRPDGELPTERHVLVGDLEAVDDRDRAPRELRVELVGRTGDLQAGPS